MPGILNALIAQLLQSANELKESNAPAAPAPAAAAEEEDDDQVARFEMTATAALKPVRLTASRFFHALAWLRPCVSREGEGEGEGVFVCRCVLVCTNVKGSSMAAGGAVALPN